MRVTPADVVYTLFTSGSTGTPKGVVVEHQQLANYVHGVVARLDLPGGSTFATVSTIAADLGNTSIFSSLCTGGCLHIIAEARLSDPDAMAESRPDAHRLSEDRAIPSRCVARLCASRADPVVRAARDGRRSVELAPGREDQVARTPLCDLQSLRSNRNHSGRGGLSVHRWPAHRSQRHAPDRASTCRFSDLPAGRQHETRPDRHRWRTAHRRTRSGPRVHESPRSDRGTFHPPPLQRSGRPPLQDWRPGPLSPDGNIEFSAERTIRSRFEASASSWAKSSPCSESIGRFEGSWFSLETTVLQEPD